MSGRVLCVRSIKFLSVSTIFPLEIGTVVLTVSDSVVLTVWYVLFFKGTVVLTVWYVLFFKGTVV
jgi:hypothetical protein